MKNMRNARISMKKSFAVIFTLVMLITVLVAPLDRTQAAAKPNAPTVNVKLNDDGIPVITWKKVSGVTGYRVYRKCADDSKWVKVSTTTKLKLTDKKLQAESGSVVKYAVRSYVKNAKGKTTWSSYSKTKKVTLPEKDQELYVSGEIIPMHAFITSPFLNSIPKEELREWYFFYDVEGIGDYEIKYCFAEMPTDDESIIDIGDDSLKGYYKDGHLRIYAPIGYSMYTEETDTNYNSICSSAWFYNKDVSLDKVLEIAKNVAFKIIDVQAMTDPETWTYESVYKKQ